MDLMVTGGRVVVAGPDTRALLASGTDGTVALRLAPGAAPYVLGLPAAEIRDARPEFGQLGLRHRPDPSVLSGGATVLEQWALGLAGRAEIPRWPGEVVRLARSGAQVGRIAADLGWSTRELHRHCLFAFGYGPTTLRRILRFRAALTAADTGRPLAEVAAACRFADQAHLARDARDLAGVSMSALLRERRVDQPAREA